MEKINIILETSKGDWQDTILMVTLSRYHLKSTQKITRQWVHCRLYCITRQENSKGISCVNNGISSQNGILVNHNKLFLELQITNIYALSIDTVHLETVPKSWQFLFYIFLLFKMTDHNSIIPYVIFVLLQISK